MSTDICPVCGWPAATVQPAGDKTLVGCVVCGRFTLTSGLADRLHYEPAGFTDLLPALAVYLRQANDDGLEPALSSNNWQSLAQSTRHRSPSWKIRRLLELFARERQPPGAWLRYDGSGRTRQFLLLQRSAGAESEDELNFLLDALIETGDVQRMPPPQRPDSGKGPIVRVTAKGWGKLEASGAVGVPGRCFVAMSFKPELKATAYELGIRPALETDCGLDARRVDRIEHVGSINDRIISEIRQAQSCVADFTGQREGVYFEAGFVLGLARPVIWTCRADDIENLHFDIRHYNFIDWIGPADLRERLTNRLRALGLARKLE